VKEKDEEIVNSFLDRGIILISGRITQEHLEIVQKAFVRFYLKQQKKVMVLISSYGGDAIIGLEIHDLFKLYPGEITGIVVGKAMSAASYILQGCSIRCATFNSRILIHNGRREVDNDILLDDDQLEEYVENNKKRRERVHRLLAAATKQPVGIIMGECKRDQEMDVDQAIKFGLLDKIWTEKLPWNPGEEIK